MTRTACKYGPACYSAAFTITSLGADGLPQVRVGRWEDGSHLEWIGSLRGDLSPSDPAVLVFASVCWHSPLQWI